MSSSTASSSSARLWITPLASATPGPPRSSFEISSPVDSLTTGGPAVKIAPWRLMMVKSHTGATRAPWPADGPSKPADGRNLAGALRLREQVGGGAAVMLTAGPETGALQEHHERNLVAQRQLGEPVALGVAAGADAAGQRGEVLGADHHR